MKIIGWSVSFNKIVKQIPDSHYKTLVHLSTPFNEKNKIQAIKNNSQCPLDAIRNAHDGRKKK